MARPKQNVIKKTFNLSLYPSEGDIVEAIRSQCNGIARSKLFMDMLTYFLHNVSWSTSDNKYPMIKLTYFGNSCMWQTYDTDESIMEYDTPADDEIFSGQFHTLDALNYAFKRFPNMIYNEDL